MKKMPLPKFLLFTALGTVIWNTVLTFAGMALGAAWPEILVVMKQYERVVLVLLVIGVIAFVAWKIMQMRADKAALAAKPSSE